MSSLLDYPITQLKGVGEKLASKFVKLHIETIQDLLFHLPIRYLDKTKICPINDVLADNYVVVQGIIQKVQVIPRPKKWMQAIIADSSGKLSVRMFHFNHNQLASWQVGEQVRCSGAVSVGKYGKQMVHPEYDFIQAGETLAVEQFLTPIYSTVEGLNQKIFLKLITQIFDLLKHNRQLLDILPVAYTKHIDFSSLHDALYQVHFPSPDIISEILEIGMHPAQRRLSFEEILAHHLSLRKLKQQHQAANAQPIINKGELFSKLLANLSFSLTAAQHRVIDEIRQDLKLAYPMQRLVQGDVGCGKTLVAIASGLFCIESNMQVAILVPTEILAKQHYLNCHKLLAPLGVTCHLVTGGYKNKQVLEQIQGIKDGMYQLVIGTHALFEHGICFANLGLVVIDEQHRFGVEQRKAMLDKGSSAAAVPHQLLLSATPIPRTLAMTYYANLDYSVIDEMPPNRKPITTLVLNQAKREQVIGKIKNLCQQGQQVYWVCTLIEESEALQCNAAEDVYNELQNLLPELTIGLVHGKTLSKDKQQIMEDFKLGEIKVLVATVVIEVGVDVANASMMVIDNAERLGLSQLHQLRGRVGRGELVSYCILLYQSPLTEKAKYRLTSLRESNDGFHIAEADLKQRGPGDLFGTRQAGQMQFKIANLQRDQDLLASVNQAASNILNNEPEIAEKLIARWLRLELSMSVV